MVQEIWFKKSSSRKVVDHKKKFEIAEPLFYTFLEKWLQNKLSLDLAADLKKKLTL